MAIPILDLPVMRNGVFDAFLRLKEVLFFRP
jgi:hypothetical protein